PGSRRLSYLATFPTRRSSDLHASYIAPVRPVLWAVSAVAVLVLIIGAANVAVLMLVRGAGREREFAVRLALGASEGRLARLLARSEEHTSELQSRENLVCRLL